MLSTQEITAAEAEGLFVPNADIIEAYVEYHKLKAQIERLEKAMVPLKDKIRECLEENHAKGLIDPETGRKMVTYSEVTRETADKKKMIEELGPEVVDMYFKRTVSNRMSIK